MKNTSNRHSITEPTTTMQSKSNTPKNKSAAPKDDATVGKEDLEGKGKEVKSLEKVPTKCVVMTKECVAELHVKQGFCETFLDPCFGCLCVEPPDNCEWEVKKSQLIQHGLKHNIKFAKRHFDIRKCCCKVRCALHDHCIWEKCSPLGEDQRIPVPACVKAGIKNAFLNPLKKFTGFSSLKQN